MGNFSGQSINELHSFHAERPGLPVAATHSPLTAMGMEDFNPEKFQLG